LKYNCIQARIINSNCIKSLDGHQIKVIPFNYINMNELRKDMYYFFEVYQDNNSYIILDIISRYD
jgi:hypothetical protein